MEALFGSVNSGDIVKLLLQLALLLGLARLLGGICQNLGQPAVVGETLAGILMGPSLLSGLFPALGELILPQTALQGRLLDGIAYIGAMLLLAVTGLGTDLGLIRRRSGVASGIAFGGLLFSLATGLALGSAIPDELLTDPANRPIFMLFLATALSLTAVPVLAGVLLELGLMRRETGQTLLAAGMIDGLAGWTLLGIVTALAAAGAVTAGTVAEAVLLVITFVVATATVGRWVAGRGLDLVTERLEGQDQVITLFVVLILVGGASAQMLHIEAMIGAFAIGLIWSRLPRLPAEAIRRIESTTLAVFAPILFAIAGLKVDLGAILAPPLLWITILVIAVATFGKVMGAYLGGRLFSQQDHWSSLAHGFGLNARGALGIVVATIGLRLGILTGEMFSMIVVMALATSMVAPAVLRHCLSRVQPGEEEQLRLEKQEALVGTFTASVKSTLIPVRPRNELAGAQTIQAVISDRLAEVHGTDTTLFAVSGAGTTELAGHYLTRLEALFARPVRSRVVPGDDPVAAILREAARGYGLMMIGTPTMSDADGSLFGEVIDDLVRLSPIPTIVVRGGAVDDDWRPTRILVPTNGSSAARRATDLALVVARPEDTVTGVHVVPAVPGHLGPSLALDITAELRLTAGRLQQSIATEVREAPDVETGILEAIGTTNADLLLLGTSLRAGTTRLRLGPRVEYLVRHAPCPVVIVNGP